MDITEKDLNLMVQIVHNKYAHLQAQGHKRSPVDAALLGASLVAIKQALGHGRYQLFVEERLLFNVRTARRFKENLWSYLVEKHREEEEEEEVDRRMKALLWPAATVELERERVKALRSQTRRR